MPSALFLLLRLHFRGVIRRMLRGVRTPRGAAFLGLGILVIFAWLGPSLYRAYRMPRTDASFVRTVAPFALLGFCLGNLFASIGENAIAFTGAEVDFLFPGPFTRRSLLLFKIVKTALGTTFTALIFSIVFLRYGGSWLSCFIGVWLTIQFMQLFAISAMMITQTLGEQIASGTRRAVLVVVLGLIALAAAPVVASHLNEKPVELMKRVHATTAGKILLAPFDVFGRAITARRGTHDLAVWGSTALAIDVAMLLAVFGLDANYLETAATVSQKRYERVQRMRRGGIGAFNPRGSTRLRVGPVPWLGGVGPIAWRQMTGALRSSRSLLIVLVIVGIGAGSVVFQQRGEPGKSAVGTLFGVIAWMNVLFISMLKFDFRDELDRLDLLRSLPIRPAAVAAAELVTPVLVMTGIQGLLLIGLYFTVPAARAYVLPAAAFAVPFNVLLAGIENLLFLMFPLRSAGLIAGDMQLVGRQMVVFLCKFLLLVVGLTLAAVLGVGGFILGGRSWAAFGFASWVGLMVVSAGIVPLIARTFSRFDPSVDTPT
jgi:hypothetical protein